MKPSVLQPYREPLANILLPLLNGLTRRTLVRHGAAQHDVRIMGTTINYYTHGPAAALGNTGDQLPLLLIHGLADSALTWAGVMPRLARAHAVYALDLPGYGLSGLPHGRSFMPLNDMRALLDTFLQTVVGRPAVVVGSSLGGWLAVKLANSSPDWVRGIALLNPGGARLGGRASWESFAEIIQVRDPKAARQLFRSMFGMRPPLLEFVGQRSIQQLFQRTVVSEFAATLEEDEFLRADELAQVNVPAALVFGLSDRFLPLGSLEFFSQNLPQVSQLLIRYAGHLPQRERPRTVARFLHTFAAELAGTKLNAQPHLPAVVTPEQSPVTVMDESKKD